MLKASYFIIHFTGTFVWCENTIKSLSSLLVKEWNYIQVGVVISSFSFEYVLI
jgi:hypothetical protein